MSDYIVNAITSNGAIRVVAADTTELCNRAQEIHKMSSEIQSLAGLATGLQALGSQDAE